MLPITGAFLLNLLFSPVVKYLNRIRMLSGRTASRLRWWIKSDQKAVMHFRDEVITLIKQKSRWRQARPCGPYLIMLVPARPKNSSAQRRVAEDCNYYECSETEIF